MGSYFQSATAIKESLRTLTDLLQRRPELGGELEPALAMLDQADREGRGLYVTF